LIRTEIAYIRALSEIVRLEALLGIDSQSSHIGDAITAGYEADAESLTLLLAETEAYRLMEKGELRLLSDLSKIGEWLVTLRFARKLTEVEFAAITGVSPQQVSNDERKGYSGIGARRAHRLLEALGIEYQVRPIFPESVSEELPIDLAVDPIDTPAPEPVAEYQDIPSRVAELLRSDTSISMEQALHLSYTFNQLYATYISVLPASQLKPVE